MPDNRPVSGGWLDFSYVVQSVPTLSLDVIRQVNNARAQLLLIVFQAGKRFFEQADSQRLLGQNLGVNRGLIPFTFAYFRCIFRRMDDLREQFMSVLESENVDIMSKKFFYEVWFSDAEKAEIEDPLIAQGIEQGIEQRIEQGVERGREEGQCQMRMAAVQSMLQQGLDVAIIAKCLSLEEDEVRAIQADLS